MRTAARKMKKTLRRLSALALAMAIAVLSMTTVAYAEDERNSDEVLGWFESVPINIFDGKVAPGSEGEHEFSVRNTSDYDLHYELMFYSENGLIPIQYRIKSGDEYLIGSESEWKSITDADHAVKSNGTIPVNGKLDLLIEWQWPFESESENDEADTLIGIGAAEETFHIAIIGTGRESNRVPIIVKSDFVEPITPRLFPTITLALGFLCKTGLKQYRKRKKEESVNENC